MMNNLFSTFDPSTSYNFSLNWLSPLFFMLIIPNLYWLLPSKYMIIFNNLNNYMIKEMNTNLINKNNLMNLLMFNSLFMFIMFNNFISMFPFIFNSTSHMNFSLMFSLTLWLSYMIYGWMNYTNHMLIHLTPQGTPYILMPFMVLIELISNIIRPLTLAIRLSANIIAGHLLLTLISQSMINLNIMFTMMMILTQSILMILEVAVSFIQAYVFTTLSSLYSTETS
uniref:ATP synthase subunit a n=1 Tax=Aegilips sp. ZJUH 20220002 TaxID=2943451 RepID=A0A9E8K0C7_9HYME|nr:ATP synthase F0 subunit 6 [Aegilips sp. ZJUH 20220002]